MGRFAALVTFDGTSFCGWQRQDKASQGGKKAGRSVQAAFEAALEQITHVHVPVTSSGRTDSGVHASGMVCHFDLSDERQWDIDILFRALNGILRPSIRIIGVQPVEPEFHARKSAVSKQYSYYFQQGPCPLPHLEPYSWWIRKRLDLDAMRRSLAHLHGKHDFKPFQASGSTVKTSIREILEAEIEVQPIVFPALPLMGTRQHSGTLNEIFMVRLRLVGTGFLKQMVRSIAGTLLEVGEGRRHPDSTQQILLELDRKKVGVTAPGRALWLERVNYNGLNW
jgi:tRNA pseudouridine38-40 synthase